jgi:hypothetical protein
MLADGRYPYPLTITDFATRYLITCDALSTTKEIWLVTFTDYDVGSFDDEICRLEPIENPFGPKVLPMSPE